MSSLNRFDVSPIISHECRTFGFGINPSTIEALRPGLCCITTQIFVVGEIKGFHYCT